MNGALFELAGCLTIVSSFMFMLLMTRPMLIIAVLLAVEGLILVRIGYGMHYENQNNQEIRN
jgi:hypothetical protein